MKRSRLLSLLCSSAIFAVAGHAAEPAAPLVPNANFETDANADQWPDGWGKAKAGGTWETEEGNHFIRLKSSTPGEMVMLYQQIALPDAVKAIELTFKWRVSDLKKGKQPWFDARIMMDIKDAEGKKLKGAPSPNTGKNTEGWVEKSVKFLVPAGAKTLDFMPTLFNVESGTLDLDEVVIKATDPAPLQADAEAKAAAEKEKREKIAAASQAKAAAELTKSGSLIPNGNFETEAKKPAGAPEGWGSMAKGVSWENEEGNRFIRLTSTEPGKTTMIYRLIPIPADTKALEMTWRWRITDLKAGKEAWFDARFMMEWKDAAGKNIGAKPSPPYTRNNTAGWVEKKTAFLVPEGAVTLEMIPSLFQVQKGTLDIDDLVLKPADPAVLIAAREKAEAERKAAEIPAEEPQRDKWPQQLHVAGNQVLKKDGSPIWLQGVNVVSLEWNARGEQVMKATKVALEEWGANIIRLPVKEEYWFGEAAKGGGDVYRKLIDDLVTFTANRGAYLMIDLHRYKAPRQEHADFWKDAAARYKNHPAVIFDLFNEPHGTSWEVWRNGGFVAEKTKAGDEDNFTTAEEKAKAAKGFQSVGMQGLLDTVRGTGARNVVLVGGLDYAYDLSGIANGFALKDTSDSNGIILSTHIYPWKKDWKDKVLCVADKYPILVGEVGAPEKKMNWLPAEMQEEAVTWVPEMIGFIQKNKFHWTAFAFHPKAGPAMLEDWSYKPNAVWGAFVKRAFAGEQFELKRLR